MGKPGIPQLSSPVSSLSGTGPGISARLGNLGILSVQDLLFHLPYRYIDRTSLQPIGSLVPGQDAQIQGNIELTQLSYGRRRSLLCHLSDGTGSLVLRFFHFSRSQQAAMKNGTCLRCWGQIRRGVKGLEMIHPEYQRISADQANILEQTLTPVYPATEGLAQTRLRRLTDQALSILERSNEVLEELLPADLFLDLPLPSLRESLQYLHRPPADANLALLAQGQHPAQQRLVFEELLAHQLSLRVMRQKIRQYSANSLLNTGNTLPDLFLKNLPFRLTDAQHRVMGEINQDLDATVPMLRLIQGDVGSGKTVIAAMAAVRAISAGLQVAFMAPTEILAVQHYLNLQQWLSPLGIRVILLTGKLRANIRTEAIKLVGTDQPLIAAGTHALFQEGTSFGNLGLVIIDEQHRFGVHQRLALIEKGSIQDKQPHQLIMTATPIPRTLAMTVFADLDISVIDELPPGRQEITTVVLSSRKRDEIIKRISNVCSEGRQVYWVCTLIEESDALQCQAAVKTYEDLCVMLPGISVGLIHGRLKNSEKQQVMQAFKNGEINLLVATTVIEVGVDVPNASLMIIENAERLGLAQLHQLRGRVGRGREKSTCVLLYNPPLTEMAQARLETMRYCSDGFIIAEKDMELRGPGDMLGTRQTGLPQMRIANLLRDAGYLPRISRIADIMLKGNPKLAGKLTRRWLSNRIEYSNV